MSTDTHDFTQTPPPNALTALLMPHDPSPERVVDVVRGLAGAAGAEVVPIPLAHLRGPTGGSGVMAAYNRKVDQIGVDPVMEQTAPGHFVALSILASLISWAGHPSRLGHWQHIEVTNREQRARIALVGIVGSTLLMKALGIPEHRFESLVVAQMAHIMATLTEAEPTEAEVGREFDAAWPHAAQAAEWVMRRALTQVLQWRKAKGDLTAEERVAIHELDEALAQPGPMFQRGDQRSPRWPNQPTNP